MRFRCPNCDHAVEIVEQPDIASADTEMITCPTCHSQFSCAGDTTETLVPAAGMKIGQFEIQEIVGEGAFGIVYRAWDTDLQRTVAVKIPRRDRISKDSGRLFLREARTAAQIRHPNIVQVFEVGQFDESFYIATEFIDGITLTDWLRLRQRTHREIAELVRTICIAVQAAHDAGVVHRDLKPGNILMDRQDVPHVADFGLAHREHGADITVTRDGQIIGTPSYMSPEQARGDNEQISHLSDVWAIGVVLYEILTGQRPFAASSSHTVLYRILTEDAAFPRKPDAAIPGDLHTITLHAMQKTPSARYASAGVMAEDLQRYLDGRPILARPVSHVLRTWKLVKRNPVTSCLAFLVLLAPLAFLLQFLLLRNPGSLASGIVSVPLTHPVRMEYTLSGDSVPVSTTATWAVVPLDPETRIPIQDRIIRQQASAVFEARLEPSEYLVVVSVAGFGFHEVYRTVPAEPRSTGNLPYNHLSSLLLNDGTVSLPPVAIRSDSAVTTGMGSIEGGSFQMGDDLTYRVRHERSVDSFFIDVTEVTFDEFRSFRTIGEPISEPRGKFPVDNLNWHAATAYAEFAGKRLPSEAEFEYAATNNGTTAFPSGDSNPLDSTRWEYAEAGMPVADRRLDQPVFGLHSNVAEWTDSLMLPYPGMTELPQDVAELMDFWDGRVVRGGPVTQGPNDRSLNSWDQPPTFRGGWQATMRDSEIGFRCARSAAPRFIEN